MAQYVFTMNGVGKIVPPRREILKNIYLSFFPGAKIGVLGLNGAGKSTLLKIMAGIDTDIIGEARPIPDIKVGYLPQEPALDPDKNVRGNVEDGLREPLDAIAALEGICAAYADEDVDFEALGKQQEKYESIIQAWDAENLDNTLERAADALRLPPWDASVENLSGGEKRRVALCRLMLSRPDILLLDEPTNHLDAESVFWLERFLADFNGIVVAVTHDRYFLDNVAGWILELDRGEGIPFEGIYSQWLENKEQRLQHEERAETSRHKAIKQELDWVRSNPKGRHAKSKARLARFAEMNSREFQKRSETNEIYIPPGQRLGELVIEFNNVSKRFEDKTLFENLSFKIPQGALVGIIGGNAAGKSTLFRMISGEIQADEGDIRLGETVEVAFVEQSRESLDDDKTVWEEISGGLDNLMIGNYEVSSRAYVGRFNFKGTDQQKRVGDLSGGERGQLHLANTLKQGANVLLLDEPSNDLDVETLRALEEAILAFPGCAMVISHDRWFLDRIATHILAFEGDSEVVFIEGNFSDYHEDFLRRKGKDAQPQRMKYKRLEKRSC